MPLRKPEQDQRSSRDGVLPERHLTIVYLRRLVSVVLEAAILLVTTVAAYAAILYALRAAWKLYLSTHMGQQFALHFPQTARDTTALLQMELLPFAGWITIHAFVICIAVAAICRLLYVARFVHEPFGILGRVFFCGLPLTLLVATYIQPLYGFPDWSMVITIVLLPTLSVFSPCFTYAEKLLPELGDLKKPFTG